MTDRQKELINITAQIIRDEIGDEAAHDLYDHPLFDGYYKNNPRPSTFKAPTVLDPKPQATIIPKAHDVDESGMVIRRST
jgi:hypothetical protein